MFLCSCACTQAQSRPTLCDPLDCSLPGPSVHGIHLAGILKQVANSSSGRSSWPRDQSCIFCGSCIGRQTLLLLSPLGSFYVNKYFHFSERFGYWLQFEFPSRKAYSFQDLTIVANSGTSDFLEFSLWHNNM